VYDYNLSLFMDNVCIYNYRNWKKKEHSVAIITYLILIISCCRCWS